MIDLKKSEKKQKRQSEPSKSTWSKSMPNSGSPSSIQNATGFDYPERIVKIMASLDKIKSFIINHPVDIKAYEDYFSVMINFDRDGKVELGSDIIELERTIAFKYNLWIRQQAEQMIRSKMVGTEDMARLFDISKRSYLYGAPYVFDDYMLYIEWNRLPHNRFYQPRRRILAPMVSGYQDILDGKLDLLTISQPKRTGKSQTSINFVNMISGKEPDKSTLMEGAGAALVNSFYRGCCEILDPRSEYLHYDVFPLARMIGVNAEIKTINLHRNSRFPTIMCRSIDATQVGLSEATNLLYLDDLVEGREEAINRDRLEFKWDRIRGDVMGRALEGTPIVAVGTRYSLYDPIGRLQEHAKASGWNWRAIEIPAIDEKTGESNYEIEIKGEKLFTTKWFLMNKSLLSDEQWESEFQQQPFEAKGLMFPQDKLNRYFSLPVDVSPDAIFAVCDTAEGGGDSVMLPIAYVYGEDVFIEDVVFDNGPPDSTKTQCAKKLFEHKVGTAIFESNNAGTYYARDVEDIIKKMGGRISIRLRRSISNKQTRIEVASDGILKHFYFKDKSLYEPSSQYGMMMRELTTHTRSGKVKHDDAADGMALLENELRHLGMNKIELGKRMW